MSTRQIPLWQAAANPGVNDDLTNGIQIGDHWKNTSTGNLFVCTDNTDGAAVWKSLISALNGTAGAEYETLAFAAGQNSNVAAGGVSYTEMASWVYPGTNNHRSITQLESNAWAAGGPAGSGSIRVYDVTNALVIAEVTGITNSADTNILDFGSISNLPTGQAVFQLQGLGTGGRTMRAASLDITYAEV